MIFLKRRFEVIQQDIDMIAAYQQKDITLISFLSLPLDIKENRNYLNLSRG